MAWDQYSLLDSVKVQVLSFGGVGLVMCPPGSVFGRKGVIRQ